MNKKKNDYNGDDELTENIGYNNLSEDNSDQGTVKDSVRHLGKAIKTDVYEYEQKVEDYFTHNPKKAAAIAVGIGAIIGIIAGAAASKSRRKY